MCMRVCVWTDVISCSNIGGTPWEGIDAKFQIKQMSGSPFTLYFSGIVNRRERESSDMAPKAQENDSSSSMECMCACNPEACE